jgi:hypothetical protein
MFLLILSVLSIFSVFTILPLLSTLYSLLSLSLSLCSLHPVLRQGNNLINYAGLLKKMGRHDTAESAYRRACGMEGLEGGDMDGGGDGDEDGGGGGGGRGNQGRVGGKTEDSEDGSFLPPSLTSRTSRRQRRGKADATAFCNYANFVLKCKRDPAGAKNIYLKALQAHPGHKTAARNYAILLRDFPHLRTGKGTTKSQGLQGLHVGGGGRANEWVMNEMGESVVNGMEEKESNVLGEI